MCSDIGALTMFGDIFNYTIKRLDPAFLNPICTKSPITVMTQKVSLKTLR